MTPVCSVTQVKFMFKKWFTRVRAIKRCLDQAHVVAIDFFLGMGSIDS